MAGTYIKEICREGIFSAMAQKKYRNNTEHNRIHIRMICFVIEYKKIDMEMHGSVIQKNTRVIRKTTQQLT